MFKGITTIEAVHPAHIKAYSDHLSNVIRRLHFKVYYFVNLSISYALSSNLVILKRSKFHVVESNE